MMVSCKAGQGCGEMCVMGELMHVHADEQVTYAQYAWYMHVHPDAATRAPLVRPGSHRHARCHTAFSEAA